MNTSIQNGAELPLVSVIVPIYNLETSISACLDSLLSQTWPSLEIILVNDGSTDHTPDILNKYAARHSCMTAIHQNNAGVDAARYAGMDRATGQYVMFLDGDDVVFRTAWKP